MRVGGSIRDLGRNNAGGALGSRLGNSSGRNNRRGTSLSSGTRLTSGDASGGRSSLGEGADGGSLGDVKCASRDALRARRALGAAGAARATRLVRATGVARAARAAGVVGVIRAAGIVGVIGAARAARAARPLRTLGASSVSGIAGAASGRRGGSTAGLGGCGGSRRSLGSRVRGSVSDGSLRLGADSLSGGSSLLGRRGGSGLRDGVGGAFDLRGRGRGNFSGGVGAGADLVQLDRVDFPVGLLECFGVLGNVVDTALDGVAGVLDRTAGVAKDTTGPVTAESGVENELLGLEALVEVARALQMGHGSAKGGRVGLAAGDGLGDVAAREVPDLEEISSPLHGIHTATVLVEGVSGRALVALDHTADGAGGISTLAGGHVAEHFVIAADIARAAGVEDNLVRLVLVDTLNDIDFAVMRPVGANRPERGPRSTDAAGHVCEVDNIQALVVVLLTLDTNGFTAGSLGAQLRLVIHTHVEAAAGGDVDQAAALSIALVGIGDEAIGRVGLVEELEVVQKFLALPRFVQLVATGATFGNSRRKEGGSSERSHTPEQRSRRHLGWNAVQRNRLRKAKERK